uniref:CSON010167 protein n=1 Tax=Culicoides sonorensis TaxID=179676 RepID=A0A336JZT0_CULSO
MKYLIFLMLILTVIKINARSCNESDKSIYENPLKIKKGGSIYYDYEGKCSNNGGICINSAACMKTLTNDDLCPQSSSDVVCCKQTTIEIESCESQHDMCQESCGKGPTRYAEDCPNNMECCVLV